MWQVGDLGRFPGTSRRNQSTRNTVALEPLTGFDPDLRVNYMVPPSFNTIGVGMESQVSSEARTCIG